MHSIKSCFCSLKPRYSQSPRYKDHAILAAETTFNVNEVEALHILFEQLSSSIIDDGLIHKEEFKLALINSDSKNNLFADRLFELFDLKKNGVIEFQEFVRSLSIFHPDTPDEDKVAYFHSKYKNFLAVAFRLYDLNHTGYIERDELKEMVLATLSESDLYLADDAVETIVEKTFWEADLNGDGRIDLEEWKEMAARNPSLIKNMTLPYLREITLAFPNFVMKTEVPDSELVFQMAK